jgi:hypothetical protein
MGRKCLPWGGLILSMILPSSPAGAIWVYEPGKPKVNFVAANIKWQF